MLLLGGQSVVRIGVLRTQFIEKSSGLCMYPQHVLHENMLVGSNVYVKHLSSLAKFT